MPQIAFLKVDGHDLAAGDVVKMGFAEPYEIVEIGDVQYIPGRGDVRQGVIRWTATGRTEPRTFGNFKLQYYIVVGGAKIEAANDGTALLEPVVAAYIWRGQPAV